VALAVWHWGEARTALVEQLGGRWAGGVRLPEYNPCQLSYANGMRVELLEPGTDSSSFLQRFLRRSGAGPHHVTFKVDDIRLAIRRAREAGLEIVRERLDNPAWQEAFLHPKSTGIGFVIQLAQSVLDPGSAMAASPGSISAAEAGLAGSAPMAAIPFFTNAVPDLDRATQLLTEVLHGQVAEEGSHDGVRFRSMAWQPDGARLVLTTGAHGAGGIPLAGIQAIAATTAAGPVSPADRHLCGWELSPVIAELGIRLLTRETT
jgi:methylmalonyl-CoA/ethylmalonyl-CoA epimerase